MRTGIVTSRGRVYQVQFGTAPPVMVVRNQLMGIPTPESRYRRSKSGQMVPVTSTGQDGALRTVTTRGGRNVQVGDAPPFVVAGDVGYPSAPGHLATYQDGVLVRRGGVRVPPDKFLGSTTGGDFITLQDAALLGLYDRLAVVLGGGQYFLEDGSGGTAVATGTLIVIPKEVQIVLSASPTVQLGKVVLPNTATVQKLRAPNASFNIYTRDGLLLVLNPYDGVGV